MKNNSPQGASEVVPFRIRFGVTGHRTLPDAADIAVKLREVFTSVLPEMVNTLGNGILQPEGITPIAYTILTPLAEGADRLVAMEALATLNGSTIEVVLPLQKKDYLEDFQTEESKKEFEDLLSKARRPFSLRSELLDDDATGPEREDMRRQAYEDVGRYIVNNSDILIALWDGEHSRNKGSTAEILAYARSKNHPAIIVSTKKPFGITIEKGTGLEFGSYQRIEEFNSFGVSGSEYSAALEDMSKTYFGDDALVSEKAKTLIQEILFPFYIKASKIAENNQRLFHLVGGVTYIFSALSIAVIVAGVLFTTDYIYAVFAEFFLLIIILVSVTYCNSRQTHSRWIETRFLVERIRTGIFFAACGIEPSPIIVPQYMRAAHESKDWMIRVFYEIWNRLPTMESWSETTPIQSAQYVAKYWITDQINHHRKKSEQTEKIGALLEQGGMIIFFIAMLAALAHLVDFYCIHWESKAFEYALLLCAIVLPAVGASLAGIRSYREYSRLATRSKHMADALEEVQKQFTEVRNQSMLRSVMYETETLTLRETQDWLMLMKTVALKPEA
jgi:hypothetical protein